MNVERKDNLNFERRAVDYNCTNFLRIILCYPCHSVRVCFFRLIMFSKIDLMIPELKAFLCEYPWINGDEELNYHFNKFIERFNNDDHRQYDVWRISNLPFIAIRKDGYWTNIGNYTAFEIFGFLFENTYDTRCYDIFSYLLNLTNNFSKFEYRYKNVIEAITNKVFREKLLEQFNLKKKEYEYSKILKLHNPKLTKFCNVKIFFE